MHTARISQTTDYIHMYIYQTCYLLQAVTREAVCKYEVLHAVVRASKIRSGLRSNIR